MRSSTTKSSMTSHRQIKASVLLAIAAMTLVLAGCISVSTGEHSEGDVPDENQKHLFKVDGVPTIDVSGFNGSIELVTGEDGVVDVESTLRIPNRITYSATSNGNTVTIVAKKTGSGITIGRSPGVEIHLIVPKHTTINAETSNGHIKVDGISGFGDLETSNGKITVTGSDGKFTADTSNGKITLSGVEGQFEAHTSNGTIDFSGSLSADGISDFATSNGTIEVAFIGDPDVSIDARTSNGSASSDRPILATTTEKTRLVGKFGDGSASLKLRTSNGSINIR
jgi:DUF4097 and DUF4098 domain-containing protein YvlB